MTTTRPPVDLEHKAAAALLEPRPAPGGRPRSTPGTGATAVDTDTGTITAIVAVTGVVDDVNDLLSPGCFARTLREREPRMVLGHDWNRPVGRTVSSIELLPGDPRLPRTAPDGTPWPSTAGGLLVKARYLLGTRDGREAYEVAKAFGASQAFSIGFKVTPGGSRQRGGVRVITDLSVYEYSPVLHGANRLASLLDVKSSGGRSPAREVKATGGVVAGRRMFFPAACSICGQPAAASVSPLPSGTRLICTGCLATVDRLGTDSGYLDPADLAAADQLDELTAEEEFERALAADRPWVLESDGTLSPDRADPAKGRAWGQDTRRAWGQP